MSTLNYLDENNELHKFGVIPKNYIRKVDELEDAVDTLTQNETGDYIDLTSYTQDWYTFPSDGYLLSSTSDNASMTVRLRGATSNYNIQSITKNGENDVIYVRKGMRTILYASTGSVALRFYPFTS